MQMTSDIPLKFYISNGFIFSTSFISILPMIHLTRLSVRSIIKSRLAYPTLTRVSQQIVVL